MNVGALTHGCAATRSGAVSNPSAPGKRVVVALLCLIGAAIAARLAAYQIGWTGVPWEPFFGDGSRRVLHSSFSRSLPFPDAALGLVAYVAEAAAVASGNSARWRTHPLSVYAYAVIAFGLAFGSVVLTLLQIASIHAFCTLCLMSSFLSFVLVVPAATEFAAARRARRSQ